VKMCNTASVVAEERYTIGCRYKYGPWTSSDSIDKFAVVDAFYNVIYRPSYSLFYVSIISYHNK
jgi:hypothetical protein